MAGQKSDISLIAGLQGGGSIHGESGKQIQSQIASIMGEINKKPIKIKIELDKSSISNFKQELNSLTAYARNQANQIKAAYNGIPPVDSGGSGGSGSGGSGGGQKNQYADVIKYNNVLAKTETMLKQVNEARKKWTEASNNSATSKEYSDLEQYSNGLIELADKLKKKTISIEEAQKILSEINAGFKEASGVIRSADMDFDLDDKTKKILRARKELEAMRKNLKKWGSAEAGDSHIDYHKYDQQATSLEVLIRAFEKGGVSIEKFDAALLRIRTRASNAATAIAKAGENQTKAKSLEEYIKQLKQVEALIEQNKKNLRDWSAARSGNTSSAFQGIEDVIKNLEDLREEILNTGEAVEDFDKQMASSKYDASKHNTTIKNAERNYKTFGDRVFGVVDEMAGYIDTMDIMFEAVAYGKRMVEAVTSIDTAMTELRKVTEETESTYASFLDKASVRAKELGATVADVVSASADFSRLGHDLEGASSLADAALVYKNVGDGISDVETASSSIISTMQAFGIEAENAMSIVDKFNATGNRFAISSAGIGDALLNSAASLAAAGNTLDESIALIVSANTTIQDPGKVGKCLPNNAVMY